MKTFSPGLSDSIASVIPDPRPCPHCDSSSHIAGGLCVGCLLEAGLDPADEGESETLTGILAEVNLPDQNWRLGNYEILEEIGRGGMGVIYRARQRHSRRIVAVKRVLSYHSDSRETLARFRREAQAAASLDHPNILPIYEVSESDDGLPFFSMKFAPGGTLQQVAPALRSDPRQCVALVAKISRAVQYAHSKGILHRDLKPGNILLDARGEPLVSDFGLAKWLDATSDLTRTLTIFGTPGYIAPEQASSAAADLKPTADIYSLGAILFDLLAGRPPFLGAHALSVIRQAAENPAPKLRSLSKVADRDLETICARCLEREPSARYHSAHDLAEDLERWLEGRPILARPVSPPAQLWRWSKRKPAMAASLITCLLLAIVTAVWELRTHELEKAAQQEALIKHSIGILPFLNLDTVTSDPVLTSGLAQILQSGLEQSGPTRVVNLLEAKPWFAGTGNAQEINDVNKSLRARTVLTGTERVVHGKQRISARLMNAATGEILWTKCVEIPLASSDLKVAVLQFVPAIHSILELNDWSVMRVSSRDPGLSNPAAQEFITSARQLMLRMTIEDFDRALQCLQRAADLEPRSAIVHAYIAIAAAGRTHCVRDEGLLERARIEAELALNLDRDSPVAHRALAGVFYLQEKFPAALEEQTRAIEAGGPEERSVMSIGTILFRLGRPAYALGWFEMARRWATLPGEFDAWIGDCWTQMGDDERAESAYRRALDLRPELSDGWIGLCRLRLLQGDVSGARRFWNEKGDRLRTSNDSDRKPELMLAQLEFYTRNYLVAERLYGALAQKDQSVGEDFYGAIGCGSALGRLRQLLGDEAGGRRLLEQCLAREAAKQAISQNPATLYEIAAIEASLGKPELALEHLRAAMSAGWIDFRSMRLDPRFDSIVHDPRFEFFKDSVSRSVAAMRRQAVQPFNLASNDEEKMKSK
jgi:serine/threonine protein kinase/tetratricopeptide (TPR) repeat protein